MKQVFKSVFWGVLGKIQLDYESEVYVVVRDEIGHDRLISEGGFSHWPIGPDPIQTAIAQHES